MPPLKFNAEAQKKEPITVRVRGREEKLKPRFENLVPSKNRDAQDDLPAA